MKYVLLIITALLLPLKQSFADTLVLVHGYLGSADSWDRGGVGAALASRGWQPGGLLLPAARGAQLVPGPGLQAEQRFVTVSLPSLAPLALQADVLHAMLRTLAAQRPDERLILAGHSAGGVVARLVMVRHQDLPVRGLISIASPHLGTARALQGLDYTDDGFPWSALKSFFTGDLYDLLRDSRPLLVDLLPARPGSLLDWLNRQLHPDRHYASVVRLGPAGQGDELVPAYSQDLRAVAGLGARAQTFTTAAGHALRPADGVLLADIIAGWGS